MPTSSKLALLFVVLLLTACGSAEPAATATPAPTATPAGPTTLNICSSEEPSSLYLYSDNSESARAIRQAIYDGPFDKQAYEPVAVILESVPTLDTGGAVLQAVTVTEGTLIVDADNVVRPLQAGVRVRPAGCKDGNCVVEYTGGEIQMDQLVVTFTLKPGLTWSDGTPLTASDSVYSFELNSDAATPGDKTRVQRTASYTASDDHTAVWTGLPGYRDPGYRTNFWTPLPRHAWSATTAAADLLASPMAAQTPLGWGPYVINEWVAGERISLTRNANYWRAGESLPQFSELNFIFVADPAASLLSGECDLALPSDAPAADLQTAGAQVYYAPAGSWQHLELGIKPLTYDDGLNVFVDRADYFGDVRMRQVLALCIDRASLVAQFGVGQGAVPNEYLPPAHPLSNSAVNTYSFDPAAANAILDELGWLTGADGLRVNQFYVGAMQGVPLSLNLQVADDEESLAIVTLLQQSLEDCGIAVNILSAPAEQAFAPGPGGSVFGRAFDLAVFAWPFTEHSACSLYLSDAVPGPDLNTYSYGWGGWNISGYQSGDYDAACEAALISLPGEPGYGDAERQAQAYYAEQLPSIPLFVPYEVAAARADFCGFSIEAGSSLLQSIEAYGYAEWCQ